MSDKIMTLHPEGKQGVNIDRLKYDKMRAAMLAVIGREPSVPFTGLGDKVYQELNGDFDGSIGWYTTTVKLDLEARGLIERVPDVSPQRLRLKQQ
jgi:hypothetical protein